MRYESIKLYIIEIYHAEFGTWLEFERFSENDSYKKVEKRFKIITSQETNFDKFNYRLSEVIIKPIITMEYFDENAR